MVSTIHAAIQKSPFKNVYWFSHLLLSSEQFGALGRVKERQLLELVAVVENLSAQSNFSDDEKFLLLKNTLLTEIPNIAVPGTKTHISASKLAQQLGRDVKTIDDVIIFCMVMKYVVAPINHAITLVPADDKKFCETAAKNILDTFGEEKIYSLIATWDDLGVKGCSDAERALLVEEFMRLVENLSALKIKHATFDDNLILTAFVQEFERLLGQKRKARGGTSLETFIDFIFDYYGFKSASKPKNFNQAVDVDKWFKCRDGWFVGISCKRSLREHWRQLSQVDRETLTQFKIRELWHLITFDDDLSDDKIVELGDRGQIFYLPDESDVYKNYFAKPDTENYVRSLNNFVGDIRNLI